MKKKNRFLDFMNNGCTVVLLLGGTTSFFILVGIIGLIRSYMGYNEIDIDNSYMLQRYTFSREYIQDSTKNGYEVLWFTTKAVTDKRIKEIKSRKHIRDSYKKFKNEAADHFNHDLINTDIYDFVEYAKTFDIDPDVRLVNIWVYGNEYRQLYRRPHPDYPEVFTPGHDELGILYLEENDVYPYNLTAPRRYRYWKCGATSLSDERFNHVTEQDYLRVKR